MGDNGLGEDWLSAVCESEPGISGLLFTDTQVHTHMHTFAHTQQRAHTDDVHSNPRDACGGACTVKSDSMQLLVSLTRSPCDLLTTCLANEVLYVHETGERSVIAMPTTTPTHLLTVNQARRYHFLGQWELKPAAGMFW